MVKEIASNYIFGLMLSCTESDKDSLEYHDAKAALEDLDTLISAVYQWVYEMATEDGKLVLLATVAHYCTMYQQEALAQI